MWISAAASFVVFLTVPWTTIAAPVLDANLDAIAVSQQGISVLQKRQAPWQWLMNERRTTAPATAGDLNQETLDLIAMAAYAWVSNLGQHLNIGERTPMPDGGGDQLEQRASISLILMGFRGNARVRLELAYVGTNVRRQFPPNLDLPNGAGTLAERFFYHIRAEERSTAVYYARSPDRPETRFAVGYRISIDTTDTIPPDAKGGSATTGDTSSIGIPTPSLAEFISNVATFLLTATVVAEGLSLIG